MCTLGLVAKTSLAVLFALTFLEKYTRVSIFFAHKSDLMFTVFVFLILAFTLIR